MTKRYYLGIFLLALIFPGWAFSGKKLEPAPIGIKLYHFEIQGRTTPVAVWYPAVKVEGKAFDYNQQVKGSAYLSAEPDFSKAPYPLIVFSHGMGGCGYQSVFYVENLVRAGYVVVAMDHKDSAMCTMEGKPKITTGKIILATLKGGGDLSKTVMLLFKDSVADIDFSYRPKDIKELIDWSLKLNQSDEELKGIIDPERIGVSGHSLGGFTTLAVAGASYDCVAPEKWPQDRCEKAEELLAKKDELKPEEFNLIEMREMICCLEQYKGKKISYGDERVKAVLPLGPAIIFPSGAFDNIKIPVMVITGTGRFEVPIEPIQKVYEELAGPKYLLELEKVDHMTITDIAYQILPARVFLPGFRTKYKMKKEIYENFSENFFNAYLKGDKEGLDYIKDAHYPLVKIQAQP